MKSKLLSAALLMCMFMAFTTCRTLPENNDPLKELTRNGYFTLKESNESGIYGPVYIFPERHNSRLIQAQIAYALDVLREQKNINSIALEGMYIDEIMTSEKLSYESDIEKYTVLLSLFERGDIKAPELMYLAKDSYVFGIENESEHSVKPPSEDAYYALDNYLLLSILPDRGRNLWMSITDEMLDAIENEEEFLEFLDIYNPWAKETYEIIYFGKSIIEINSRLKELNEKITPVNYLLDDEFIIDFEQILNFYNAVHQRSLTMADSVYSVLQNKNEPLAMIIGANHTKEIIEQFDKNKINYYVLEPRSLDDYDIWSDLSDYKYEQRNEGLPPFENAEIARFFYSEWNSRPVISKEWFKKEESFGFLAEKTIHLVLTGQGTGSLESNGLKIVQDNLNISSPDDIKFCVENEKGERLFARALLNPNMQQFESFRKALQEIINRQYRIDDNNPPVEERIKAFSGIIETFNMGTYTVFISPTEDVLNFNPATLW